MRSSISFRSRASEPGTSRHQRSKKTVCRASSTIWVERKISISGVGAAHTNGASVAVTLSSPWKKSRRDQSVAWRSRSVASSQSWRSAAKSRSDTRHCWVSQRW